MQIADFMLLYMLNDCLWGKTKTSDYELYILKAIEE